jgi:hypothetical protein
MDAHPLTHMCLKQTIGRPPSQMHLFLDRDAQLQDYIILTRFRCLPPTLATEQFFKLAPS